MAAPSTQFANEYDHKGILMIHSEREKREQKWRALLAHAADFSRDEFEMRFRPLLSEVDDSIKLNVLINLILTQPWRPEPSSADWFFQPFGRHKSGPGLSAVVGICDHHHIRDVQALLTLSRYMSKECFPDTRFNQIPLHNPGWAHVELNRLNAICFVGRPGMFQHCPLLDTLPSTLHFSLPPDSATWRSKPVTPESAQAFHCVRQDRIGARPLFYYAKDEPDRRRDYAIVQRFRSRFGGRRVTVIIVAGATSLGTTGAAEWVTSEEFSQAITDASNQVLRRGLHDDTQMEALLEVTATIPPTAAPWQIETIKPVRLFLNDSCNALHPPRALSICVHNGKPFRVFLDGDDFRASDPVTQQLLAICEHIPAVGSPRIDLRILQSHPAFQTSKGIPTLAQVETAIRDNFKKQRFGEALVIEDKYVALRCTVNFDEDECDRVLAPPIPT